MDDPTLERRLKAKDKLIAELLEALDAIADNAGGSCENYTSGPLSCFTNGRVIGAKYGGDAVCDQCIANKAIRKAKGD